MADKIEKAATDGDHAAKDLTHARAEAAASSEAPANEPATTRTEAAAPVSKAASASKAQSPATSSESPSSDVAAPSSIEKPQDEDDIDLIPVHVAHVQTEAAASSASEKKPAATCVSTGTPASKAQSAPEPQIPQATREPSPNGSPAFAAPVASAAEKRQNDGPAEKKPPAPSPPQAPPKSKAPRPNSLGNAYMQSQDRKPTEGRVYFAIAAFVLIFTGVLAVQGWWSLRPDAPAKVPELDTSRFEGHAQRRQTILEEMEKAAKAAPQTRTSNAVTTEHGRVALAPNETKPTSRTDAHKTQRVTRKGPLPSPETEQPDPLRQQYEAEYGAASSVRAAAIKSRGQYEVAPQPGQAGHPDVRGLVLQASLVTTVASSPVGASVIASLTRGARLGDRYLAARTEIHGEVRGGGDNARVFVDFTYARLADGSTVNIDAVAMDRSGRQGIPGLRPVTGRTAGSVGLSGGQAMAHGAASAIPGFAGVLASGASAMVDAASDKSQRLDRDEVIVQAKSSTPIAIYVRSAG